MFAWISVSVLASSHAVMYKRDSRALVGWFGIIWMAPIAGAVFYLLFDRIIADLAENHPELWADINADVAWQQA